MTSLFSWQNWIDTATLAAGDQATTLPVANLKDRRVQKCWRSGTSTATYFTADFGAAQQIDVIALFGLTLSETDTVRIRLSNTALGDGEILDTTALASGVLDGYDQYVYLPEASLSARYLRIDVDAASRAAIGNFDLGRAWVGPGWFPAIGYSLGQGVKWNDDSTVIRSPRSGATFVDKTPPYRSRDISFEWLSQDDQNALMDMDRLVGRGGQMLFIPDTQGDLARDPLLGRQDQINNVTQPLNIYPAAFSRQFTLTQDL
jgi:hypothetical protein